MKTVLLAMMGLTGALLAETLDSTQFQMRARLEVKGYAGASTLTDFPVLVRLAKDRPLGFTYAAAGENGAGLRFADAEGNLIPHELDTWNTNGTSLVWVKLPTLPANGTNFWVNWSPVADATLPEVAATNVWSKYVAVMHGNAFTNAAPSELEVANGGGVAAGNAGGYLGNGFYKSAQNSIGVNLANPWKVGKLTQTGTVTVTGWMKPYSAATHICFSSIPAYGNTGFICHWESALKTFCVANGGTPYRNRSMVAKPNVWAHVGMVYDQTNLNVYYDGTNCISQASAKQLGDCGQDYWTFGSYSMRASTDSLGGYMDEMRVYDGAASADWIKAEYDAAQNDGFVEELLDESLFAHRATLSVPGYTGTSTLEDFPVLVRLQANSPVNFSYDDAGTDGANLRFADAEGHPLAFEIDTWNTAGESLVWVRLPALSRTLTTFKMLWGVSDVTALPTPAPRSTWSKYVAVMHGNAFADASPSQLSVANGGAVAAGNADALLGQSYYKSNNKAVGMNFTNPWTAGKFTTNGKMTVSGWMKLVDSGQTHVWFSTVNKFGAAGMLSYWERGTLKLQVNTSGTIAGYLFSAFPYNTWTHVAISHDSTVMKLYNNGSCLVNSTGNALGDTSLPYWTFGSYANQSSTDSFKGAMDELRIYDGTASADWIKAEYDSAHDAEFVQELADTVPATATWKGAGAAGDVTDPANWECRNVAGEVIADAVPSADFTTILVQGSAVGFSVTNAATCCGRFYQVKDATLAADCDWTGLAGRLAFVGTLDLNGQTLAVADLFGAGTITGAGTLRVTTAGTVTVEPALTGALALVKAGTGTLVAARSQSYTGGTVVEAGILRFGTTTTPAGAVTGKITIKDGAAVDLYAKAGLAYPYELEGSGPAGRGALFTSLDQNSWYTTWMGDVVLTGDASFGGGIVCNGHTVTLNGHTLTLDVDADTKRDGSKEVLFQNAQVLDEGTIRTHKGRMSSLSQGTYTFTGEQVTLDFPGTASNSGLLLRGNFKVKNLLFSGTYAYRDATTSKVTVTGRYLPNSTTLPPVLLSGTEAVLDLSTKTSTFATATGHGLSFADNAVVTLALGDRETELEEQLVSWTAPSNLSTLQFKLEQALVDENYHLRVNNEGIFIYRSGFIIILR